MKPAFRRIFITLVALSIVVAVVFVVTRTNQPAATLPPTPDPNALPNITLDQIISTPVVPTGTPGEEAGPMPWMYELFAWQMLAAMNTPALAGQRGVPDPNKQFGDPGPVVWETWKGMDEVYLPDGSTPLPWNSPLPPKVLVDTQMVDGTTFIARSSGLNVRYEERMNEDNFNYILQRQLYNRDGQMAFFCADASTPTGAPIDFPDPAIEVKASWIVLGPDDNPNQYYTSQGFYIDDAGNQVAATFGLTGFHFTSKVFPFWFWATFENVNNATATTAPGGPPIPDKEQEFNNIIHLALGASNVWSYYNLRDYQLLYDYDTAVLGNNQIESYMLESSSCITCHALASTGDLDDGRMPILYFDSDGNEKGWTGDISTIQFEDANGNIFVYNQSQSGFDDTDGNLRYKQLDFVWSLRRAQWQGTPYSCGS
ncbi:MAG: hypothetical protein K8I60_01770 [Anaerolineae bacterium]|nr:hypothetical protein [Anaerolineae bacterium]